MRENPPILLPPCLIDQYRVIFPTLDFSRIAFYEGIPRGVSGASGFTMSSGGPGRDIRIYLKSFDPRSRESFLLVAHELVHAVQIQGMVWRGRVPGSWVTYYMTHAIGRGGGVRNALENEAYSFTNGARGAGSGELRKYVNTHLRGTAPCAHATGAGPTPTPVGGESYVRAIESSLAPTKVASNVGHTWHSVINWPLAAIAGAFSVFGFSNTGGAVGALSGITAGTVGGLVAGARLGARGAAVAAVLGAYAGGIIGGAIGWGAGTVLSRPLDDRSICPRSEDPQHPV
jgi:hypothetical protein